MASFFDVKEITKLGSDAKSISLSEIGAIEKPLVKFMQAVEQRAAKNLDSKDGNASMSLRQSIVILPIKAYGKNYEIALEMNDYWKFKDLGVKGKLSGVKAPNSPFKYTNKMPPRASIEQWITNKGINPGGTRGNRLKPREDLARVIQRKIYLYGTKESKFLTNALTDDLVSAMVNEVAEALGRQISISIVTAQ